MKTNTLSPELLHKMDAYWRAANYLSVGRISATMPSTYLRRACAASATRMCSGLFYATWRS